MVVVTVMIMVFRMLMTSASQFRDNALFNPANSSIIGSLLNIAWITIMNIVYGKLAKLFNDLENHRTDTEHEDALITKTFIFQFCNSYGALFYLAFVRAHGSHNAHIPYSHTTACTLLTGDRHVALHSGVHSSVHSSH